MTAGGNANPARSFSARISDGDTFSFDGVAVRAVSANAVSAENPELLGLLDDEERDCASAFVDDMDRLRFVIARALLRSMLCERTGIEGGEFRFGKTDKGKPFVRAPERFAHDVAFSVSHSGPGVVCAVGTASAVGIDIEPFDRAMDVDRLAERVLGPDEKAALQTRPNEDARRRRMLELWTLKEAVVKASGEGISLGLSKFQIDLEDELEPTLSVETALLAPASNWTLHRFETSTGCCGALAVRR